MNIKLSLSILLIVVLFAANSFSQNKLYNVTDFVKHANKTTVITSQLQEVIDKCSKAGGGTINFPAGDYLTGTLVLKDNTIINLEAGATIYGSSDMKDYPITADDSKSLIYADGAKSIGIMGAGAINGQGDTFWRNKKKPYLRPDRLILLVNSQNIKIKDVLFTNSPNWNIEVRLCNKVWIDGISIINERKSPNTDGIDLVSSKNVFISNCYIETGDDGICPKSIGNVPTENLVVSNCVIISDDSAIKLGTRSETTIKDATFSNIIIKNTDLGLALFMKDGGNYENIRFDNISIQSAINSQPENSKPLGTFPIFIDIEKRSPESKLGTIKNIYFNNITIDSQDGNCLFLGHADSKLENIHLSNIRFTGAQRKSYANATKPRGVASLTNRSENDFSNIASYFTFVHIKGLNINQLNICDLSVNQENERTLIWGNDVHQVSINELNNKQPIPNRKLALVYFKTSNAITIKSSTPDKTDAPFLFLDGVDNKNVLLLNNNFLNLSQVLSSGTDFNYKELKSFNNLENKK